MRQSVVLSLPDPNEDLRWYYASGLRDLIHARDPDLWIHGHVHTPADDRVGPTRIICNPRGHHDEASGFDPSKTVDVARLGMKDETSRENGRCVRDETWNAMMRPPVKTVRSGRTVCGAMGEAKRKAALPPKCRGCGTPITKENDSEAHIIPNALGGNLKPKGIICRDCNTDLDGIADNALIKAFGDWPTLIGIPRDRGQNPSRVVNTRDGRRVKVEPDGSMTAIDVRYDVAEVGDGHSVQIAAGDWKTFRQLLKRANKQFPVLDPVVAEQHARMVGIQDDDQLKLGFDFDPKAIFGGIVTAIWLFLIQRTGRSFMEWNELLRYIENAQRGGGAFRYLVDGLPGLRGPNVPIGHKIIVRSVPTSGELIVYVEILGILKVGGLFASAGGPAQLIEHIYVYDVLGRTDRSREFSIDPGDFNRQDWRTVGLGGNDAEQLRDHFRSILEAVFVKRYQERFSAPEAAAEGADAPA